MKDLDLCVHSFLLVWWWEERVNCYFDTCIYHVCYQFLQNRACRFQTGVGVDFNKINFEIFVKHEVKSENFKSMVLHSASWCNNLVGCSESICHNLLDLAEDVASEVYFQFRVVFV